MTVAGYIEAATDTQIVGWAWSPADPQARLTIEARLDETLIATAIADGVRDDLARHGIGDGGHAFALALPSSVGDRRAALRIVAHAPDGAVVPLSSPVPSDMLGERLERMQRSIDAVIGSQRVLHRTLQTVAIREKSEQDRSADGALHAEQIEALEVSMARIDMHLASLAAPQLARSNAGTRSAILLSIVAIGIAIWGLVRVVPG